jgi:hypothetical protein
MVSAANAATVAAVLRAPGQPPPLALSLSQRTGFHVTINCKGGASGCGRRSLHNVNRRPVVVIKPVLLGPASSSRSAFCSACAPAGRGVQLREEECRQAGSSSGCGLKVNQVSELHSIDPCAAICPQPACCSAEILTCLALPNLLVRTWLPSREYDGLSL